MEAIPPEIKKTEVENKTLFTNGAHSGTEPIISGLNYKITKTKGAKSTTC